MEPKTTSLYGDNERGAGGKVRKPPARKFQEATPYARPPTNQHARRGGSSSSGGGGWLSKIVDPAYRLVASGATKLLPSLFSKTPASPAALLAPSENPAILDGDATANAEANEENTVTHDVPQSSERSGPSEVATNILKSNSQSDKLRQNNPKSSTDDSQISKIEQLIKGKTFSRDEINRLMEIIRSKASDVSDVERGEKNEILTTVGYNEGVMLTPFLKASDEGIQCTTVLPQPSVQEEIGASPIDIARAYMESQISEHGPGPYSASPNGEAARQLNVGLASKQIVQSSAAQLSTCWPGAMAQEQHGYTTPTQRGSHRLQDFPRTPYSRTIYSKSRAKLTQSQADRRHLLSNPIKQSQTPIFGQVKSRHDVLDNSYGSVGPIRRVQNKFASEVRPRGSIFLKSSKDAPSPIQQPIVFQGLLPDIGKNLEPGEISTSRQQQGDHAGKRLGNNSHLNPSSSRAVKRILEQLDRHKPTPQEKAAELQLATSWRKSPPGASHAMLKETISFSNPGEFGSFKKNLLDPKILSDRNEPGGDSNSRVESQEKSKAEDAIYARSQAPGIKIGNSTVISDASNGSLFSFKSTSQLQSSRESSSLQNPSQNQSNGQHVTTSPNEYGFESSKKPPLHASGTRPVLPRISVGRHNADRAMSSDNGSAFTFPISASSTMFSEPPTPSVVPFTSSGVVSQPAELPTLPAYSFGSKKSTPPLVFSFPFLSTRDAPTQVDADEIKFSFGSNKKTRLSFGSVGKDAICY